MGLWIAIGLNVSSPVILEKKEKYDTPAKRFAGVLTCVVLGLPIATAAILTNIMKGGK
jgi:hypothetical protein